MDTQPTPFLIPISQDELWAKLRELVRSELQKANSAATSTVAYDVPGLVQKPLFKAKEVCSLLSISRPTLHQWIKEGILKPYKIKSRLFFLWADIEKLVSPHENIL